MTDALANSLHAAAQEVDDRAKMLADLTERLAAQTELSASLSIDLQNLAADTAARTSQYRDTRWKPALIAWDGWPDVKDEGVPGTYDSITGIGSRMGTNGGYRAYRNLRDAIWDPDGEEAATLDLYGRGVTLDCVWPGTSTVTATRYGNDYYQNALDGAFDGDMRDYVRSIPMGRNRRSKAPLIRKIVCPWHEYDNYSPSATVNRSLARGAVKRLVGVAIREAMAMGAHPGEFGAGGLLTGSGMDDYARWGWWYYGLDADLLNSGMLVGAFDTYFKVSKDPATGITFAPLIRGRLDPFTNRFKSAGITRFVLAETAMGFDTYANPGVEVGKVEDLIDFTNQLVMWLQTTGELAATFSKPDGPASKYGSYTRPGRESALVVLASAMNTVNGASGV